MTVQEIKQRLGARFVDNAVLAEMYGLDTALTFEAQFSQVSLESLLLDIVAADEWVLYQAFEELRLEVKKLIAEQKRYKCRWYGAMGKQFQFGDALVEDQDYYDNTGLSAAEIEAKRVVKYTSAVQVTAGIRYKVATISSGVLAPLPAPQFNAFKAYMNRIKADGVKFLFVNNPPDNLKLELDIYYDPLVLDSTGKRIDGTSDTPVKDAVMAYLVSGIEFNGYFISDSCLEKIKGVDGVIVPAFRLTQARYGMLPFADFVDFYQPDAGYLILDPANLAINYIASPI